VLLDVMMPEMNGFDACREIKRRPEGLFLPVVLLTALGEQDDRNAGLEAGADDFLSKPFDRRELMLRVRTLITVRRQQRLIVEQFEALRNLDALKDDLVSLIVHDLRNPLSSIVALLGVLREEARSPDTIEDMDGAIESAGRMSEILEDLLHVRMLEDGKVPVHRELHPVRDVIREALETLTGAARERGVRLVGGGDQGAAALLDRKLVSRALWNLIANAVRYSPRGEAVEVEVRSGAGGVEIDVADRGPGIPEPVRRNLFDKFNSTEQRARGPRQGFGLGLYLVRLVATAHDGTADALPREGGGTIFRLRLPSKAAA
jgi:signal transduction histidine kinase